MCPHTPMCTKGGPDGGAKRPRAAAPGLTRTLAAQRALRPAHAAAAASSGAGAAPASHGGNSSSSKSKFHELLAAGWEGRNSRCVRALRSSWGAGVCVCVARAGREGG